MLRARHGVNLAFKHLLFWDLWWRIGGARVSRLFTIYRAGFLARVLSWRCAVCVCVVLDLPGGVRNREGSECSAARPVAAWALRRRCELLGVAVLRDDGQRLLERVRGPADDWRAALWDRWPGALLVGLLTTQPAPERRGKWPWPVCHPSLENWFDNPRFLG